MRRPRRGSSTTIKDAQVDLFVRYRRPGDSSAGRRRPSRDRRGREGLGHRERGAPSRRRAGGGRACRSSCGRQALPVTTSCGSSWHAPKLGFGIDRPANQLVVRLDPTTGIRLRRSTPRRNRRHPVDLDMEFTQEGGEGHAYEVGSSRPRYGDSTRFTGQDGVEETWRVFQPLLDAPPVHAYAKELSREATGSSRGSGSVARTVDEPVSPAPNRRQAAGRRARRCRRRSRRSPTTRSCPTVAPELIAPDGAVDWLCVPAVRLAERLRQPARPAGRVVPFGPFGINVP